MLWKVLEVAKWRSCCGKICLFIQCCWGKDQGWVDINGELR